MKPQTTKWLFSVPGRNNLSVILLTILQALNGASGVLYALFLRGIVDAAQNKDPEGFQLGVIELIALVLFQQILHAFIRHLREQICSTVENAFKARLFHVLMHKDYLHVSAIHSGEWLTRLTNDCSVVANGYVDVIPGFVEMIVKLISAVIMILILEYRFIFILIPIGLLLLLFTTLFRAKMKKLHKDVQTADGELRIQLQERLSSLLMVRSYAAEDKVETEAREKMALHKTARMKRVNFSNFCNFGFGLCMSGIYLLGIAWCGYGILKGQITFGTLTAITQLITQLQSPLANVTAYLPRYYTMLASAERLMEAENLEDDVTAEPMSTSEVRSFYRDQLEAICLNGVTFKYFPAAKSLDELSKEGLTPSVTDLTLEIHKGEYVAFTGSSGCGKSTALKLLTCVYSPDEGERWLLEKNGTKKELTPSWRRLFAYVPQGNHLMSGSIRDVISFADSDQKAPVSDEQIWSALEVACAKEFVSELSDGLDTLLGERGTGLSEGQMQRLAIARALYSESPILLLDESTSALDAETEKNLLTNLRNMTDRTVIIVTHRPAALEICDRVIPFSEPN